MRKRGVGSVHPRWMPGWVFGLLLGVLSVPCLARHCAAQARATEGASRTRQSGEPFFRSHHALTAHHPIRLELGLASLASLGAGMALYMRAEPNQSGHWRGGILFDEDVRSALVAGSSDGQRIAALASDLLLGATMLQAAFIDAGLVPALRDDADYIWQADFSLALALGITLSVGEIVKTTVGRARPYERDCDDDPESSQCQNPDRFASFYSLHSGVAFTAAGFSCAMHVDRHGYGDVAADATSCGISLLAAATVGLLRVVADRHYLSDVLVGGAMGFAVGYLVPSLLLDGDPGVPGRAAAASPSGLAGVAILPMASPSASGGGTYGVNVAGMF